MTIYSGGVPMVKIDGSIVRSLREAKGLTQLYLATSVDVTTDTISRWENKRYPKIKKENALKLAEALEVSIDEIIDHHENEDSKSEGSLEEDSVSEVGQQQETSGFKAKSLTIGIVIAVVFIGLILWFGPSVNKIEMSAVRIAPDHTAPGQPFPVVLRVDISKVPSSFILKELVSTNCSFVGSRSAGTVVDEKSGALKWIVKAKESVVNIGYMLKSSASVLDGEAIDFSGTVTQRKFSGKTHGTSGRELTTVSSYHWADSDKNNIIDDEEILIVYDDYDEIEGLDLNMDLIEEIWFGNGYKWDSGSGVFTVLP